MARRRYSELWQTECSFAQSFNQVLLPIALEVVGAALGNHRDPEQHRGILLLYCGGAVFDLGTQLGAAWHHC